MVVFRQTSHSPFQKRRSDKRAGGAGEKLVLVFTAEIQADQQAVQLGKVLKIQPQPARYRGTAPRSSLPGSGRQTAGRKAIAQDPPSPL